MVDTLSDTYSAFGSRVWYGLPVPLDGETTTADRQKHGQVRDSHRNAQVAHVCLHVQPRGQSAEEV